MPKKPILKQGEKLKKATVWGFITSTYTCQIFSPSHSACGSKKKIICIPQVIQANKMMPWDIHSRETEAAGADPQN